MKKTLLFLFFLNITLITCFAQPNLVPNPSFEIYDTCPNYAGQIRFAYPWFQPALHCNEGADLFNKCANSANPLFGVPRNTFGYHQARTGNGYGDFIAYSDEEYIEAPLNLGLIEGKLYCVDFWVSLTQSSAYAIDAIGAYFSKDSLINYFDTSIASSKIILNPTISNPKGNIISDTSNWVEISGTFIAKGGEKYITIGNFINDDSLTISTVNPLEWNYSIYYIDDVSVFDCGGDTADGINELSNKNIIIFPNPATDEIQVTGEQSAVNDIQIYNVLGAKIYTSLITDNLSPITINISAFPSSMYFMEIKTEKSVTVKKFVKE
jgi:hypothetical protein